MLLEWKDITGILSVLLSVYSSVIYIRSIFKGVTKPHLFTWIVWCILPSISFAAQLYENAGAGTWATGVTAAFAIFITALSLKYGDKHFTLSDKIALGISMSAILPWIITKDPLWSVVLVAIIDLVAFYPTFRKSWLKPHSEALGAFMISSMTMLLSITAMQVYNATTLLYPAAFILGNVAFIGFCLWRRRIIKT